MTPRFLAIASALVLAVVCPASAAPLDPQIYMLDDAPGSKSAPTSGPTSSPSMDGPNAPDPALPHDSPDADAKPDSGSGVVDQPDVVKKFDELRKALPFDIHGGAYLWHYEPDVDGKHYKRNTELYFAWLLFDVSVEEKNLGKFGFHIEARFSDTKLRPYFGSNFWVQEVYVSWKNPWADIGVLKVGKLYTRFGPFWDTGSFYGSLPYFDGLMIDPDYGASFENNWCPDGKSFGVEYSAQWFMNDGRTNGSLAGRDTVSYAGVRQRNESVLRVAPFVKFGEKGKIGVGGSFQHFDVDLPNDPGVWDEHVTRWNGEISFSYGPFTTFGTFTYQRGSQAPDYPVVGMPSEHRCYVLAGASLKPLHWLTLYYNYSYVHYAGPNRIEEHMHQPGVSVSIIDNIQLMLEYVWWYQKTPGHTTTLDSSLNVILYIHF